MSGINIPCSVRTMKPPQLDRVPTPTDLGLLGPSPSSRPGQPRPGGASQQYHQTTSPARPVVRRNQPYSPLVSIAGSGVEAVTPEATRFGASSANSQRTTPTTHGRDQHHQQQLQSGGGPSSSSNYNAFDSGAGVNFREPSGSPGPGTASKTLFVSQATTPGRKPERPLVMGSPPVVGVGSSSRGSSATTPLHHHQHPHLMSTGVGSSSPPQLQQQQRMVSSMSSASLSLEGGSPVMRHSPSVTVGGMVGPFGTVNQQQGVPSFPPRYLLGGTSPGVGIGGVVPPSASSSSPSTLLASSSSTGGAMRQSSPSFMGSPVMGGSSTIAAAAGMHRIVSPTTGGGGLAPQQSRSLQQPPHTGWGNPFSGISQPPPAHLSCRPTAVQSSFRPVMPHHQQQQPSPQRSMTTGPAQPPIHGGNSGHTPDVRSPAPGMRIMTPVAIPTSSHLSSSTATEAPKKPHGTQPLGGGSPTPTVPSTTLKEEEEEEEEKAGATPLISQGATPGTATKKKLKTSEKKKIKKLKKEKAEMEAKNAASTVESPVEAETAAEGGRNGEFSSSKICMCTMETQTDPVDIQVSGGPIPPPTTGDGKISPVGENKDDAPEPATESKIVVSASASVSACSGGAGSTHTALASVAEDEEVQEVFALSPTGTVTGARVSSGCSPTTALPAPSPSQTSARPTHLQPEPPESHVFTYTLLPVPDHLLIDLSEEESIQRIKQREKQIGFGKCTTGYANYAKHVPRHMREYANPNHPITPRANVVLSKRRYDNVLSLWRRGLHNWDLVEGGQDVEDLSCASEYSTLSALGLEPSPTNGEDSGEEVVEELQILAVNAPSASSATTTAERVETYPLRSSSSSGCARHSSSSSATPELEMPTPYSFGSEPDAHHQSRGRRGSALMGDGAQVSGGQGGMHHVASLEMFDQSWAGVVGEEEEPHEGDDVLGDSIVLQ